MALEQTLLNVSEPSLPRSSQFTCLACQIAFHTSELQRNHFRTDWHKYNLKRKMADLAPVTVHQFNEKVLAQQAHGQEVRDRVGITFHCEVCKKSYSSEPAFDSHLRSKKHRESEYQQEITVTNITTGESASQGSMTGESKSIGMMTPLTKHGIECLFCDQKHAQFDVTIHHMSKDHGFFLPDIEYLSDPEGLLISLMNKIHSDFSCLYCDKQMRSGQATVAHMIDKGHCKIDYGDIVQGSTDDGSLLRAESGELILQNGNRLGNRRLYKYYRQHHRSTVDEIGIEHRNDASNEGGNEGSRLSHSTDQPSLKNRRERRHPGLAITDGSLDQKMTKTIEGIREALIKQNFQNQVSVKHNTSNTLRQRIQNPI